MNHYRQLVLVLESDWMNPVPGVLIFIQPHWDFYNHCVCLCLACADDVKSTEVFLKVKVLVFSKGT